MNRAQNNISSHRIGFNGEAYVALLLAKAGWQVLARNYRIKSSEIDIIASKGQTLIGVEVKTRQEHILLSDNFLQSSLCNLAKYKSLYLGLNTYVERLNLSPFTLRIDLALISYSDSAYKLVNYWTELGF